MRQVRIRRAITFGILLSVLIAVFIFGGIDLGTDPDLTDPTVEPADLEGTTIETSGWVLSTDPTVIVISGDHGETAIEVESAPSVSVGEQLVIVGTITADGTIAVDTDRSFVREPWEIWYMYAVSILGAGLVVVRSLNGWRFDVETLSFEPRPEPRIDWTTGFSDQSAPEEAHG